MAKAEVQIKNLAAFHQWVGEFAASLRAPSLILLDGPMGAGKTEFVKGLVQAMGGQGVSSPTFTFHQEYPIESGIVHHFDLYRCESEADVESTGVWDVLSFPAGVAVIEWSEKLGAGHWPTQWQVTKISIVPRDDGQRILSIS